MRILVTGGAGFIGSNFVRYMLETYPDAAVTVLDKLTYAGNLDNLRDVAENPRCRFVQGDICDPAAVAEAMEGCDWVVNWAADSHVDRSLVEPGSFIQTDVYGVYVLLEEARKLGIERMVVISTDEVYGSIPEGSFRETDLLTPSSPYSASKAGGEMMARAYHVTYGLPIIITRGSNTFGPYQYPEKIIPLFITNALEERSLPVYGDGQQVRDWLYVRDHCAGVDVALRQGTPGEIYNVGGGNERTNLELTRRILELLGKPASLIQYVADRPGHDRRYSIDCAKLRALGWQPRHTFDEALAETVRWYQDNPWWWTKIKSGEYREYYQSMYGDREQMGSPRT
jgi:dTDP-glucose 4,6-dehydratase